MRRLFEIATGGVGKGLLAILLFVLMVMATYPALFDPNKAIEGGDSPLCLAKQFKMMLNDGSFSSANPAVGFGYPGYILIGDISPLVYKYLPVAKADEAHMAISSFLMMFFFYLFLREKKLSFLASLMGAVSLGLSTSIISMSKAGHVGKMMGLAYIAGSLWVMEVGFRRKSILLGLVAGLIGGYALAWGRDSVIITGLGVAVYWVWKLVISYKESKSLKPLAVLVSAGIVAVLVGYPVAMVFASGASNSIVNQQSDEQKWDWATQWSLPSSELVKLVSASYCGWDSSDPQAPYWGSMGRTSEWDTRKQGWRNFTQTNEYIGLLTVIFALVALMSSILNKRQTGTASVSRAEVILWASMTFAGLLLAMGKYAPLYALFYKIPYMADVRNPVKFMHFVSLGVSYLAAIGLNGVIESAGHGQAEVKKQFKILGWTALVFLVVFVFLMMTVPSSAKFAEALKSDGLTGAIGGIRQEMVSSLLWSIIICIIAGMASIAVLTKLSGKRLATAVFIPIIIIAVTAGDFIRVDAKYVTYSNWKNVYEYNQLFEYLKGFQRYRVKFIPHNQGIFNNWNTLLVPYHTVKSADVPSQSRPPNDINMFMSSLSRKFDRYLMLCGIRHIVIPQQFAKQIEGDLGKDIKKIRGFDLVAGSGNIPVPAWRQPDTAQFVVYEVANAYPFGKWYAVSEKVTADTASLRLAQPEFDPDRVLLVEADDSLNGQQPQTNATGQVDLSEYTISRMVMKVSSTADGWVMMNDYFDMAWKAFVDGRPANIVKADGIFMAVKVPAGTHELRLLHKGNSLTFWVPVICASAIAGLAVLSGLIALAKRRKV